MQIVDIPEAFWQQLEGEGPYLIAVRRPEWARELAGLKRVHPRPAFVAPTWGPEMTSNLMVLDLAAVCHKFEAALEDWRSALVGFRPDGTEKVIVADISGRRAVQPFSPGAHEAQHILNGGTVLTPAEREAIERVYAEEERVLAFDNL